MVRTSILIQGMVTIYIYIYFLCKEGSVKVNLSVLNQYSELFTDMIESYVGECNYCNKILSLSQGIPSQYVSPDEAVKYWRSRAPS